MENFLRDCTPGELAQAQAVVALYSQNVPLSKRPESNRPRFDNRLDNRLYRVYKHSMYTNIQPVVQPVVQPLVRFRLDNRLHRVNKHSTGCQTG